MQPSLQNPHFQTVNIKARTEAHSPKALTVTKHLKHMQQKQTLMQTRQPVVKSVSTLSQLQHKGGQNAKHYFPADSALGFAMSVPFP